MIKIEVKEIELPDGTVINIPSGEGNAKRLELLANLTLVEDAHSIAVSQDDSGNPIKAKTIVIIIHPFGSAANTSSAAAQWGFKTVNGINLEKYYNSNSNIVSNSTDAGGLWNIEQYYIELSKDNFINVVMTSNTGVRDYENWAGVGSSASLKTGNKVLDNMADDYISEINFQATWTASNVFGAGTNIKVYGG